MKDWTDLDQRLAELIEELAPPRLPDYVADISRAARAARQRPSWWGWPAWLPSASERTRGILRPLAIVAILLIVLALLGLLVGTRPRLPAPFGPARNGVLVYDDGGRVLAFDPVTSSVAPLTSGSSTDSRPAVSPDGRRIAFLRTDAGSQWLAVMDIDGSHVTAALVADGQTSVLKLEPAAWAADSHRLAVTRIVGTAPNDIAEILLFDDAGDALRQERVIRPNGLLVVEEPAWSPDGTRLAVNGGPEAEPGVEYPFVVDLASEHLLKLSGRGSSAGTGYWWPATWSPDGRRLAAAYGGSSGDLPRDIELLAADGTGVTPIGATPGDETWPAFSPDGAQLAFWRAAGPGTWRPVIVSLADSIAARTEKALDVVSTAADRLAWSPDGSMLSVLWCTGPARCNIALVDIAGGEPPRIVAQVAPKSYVDSDNQAYWSFQRLAP